MSRQLKKKSVSEKRKKKTALESEKQADMSSEISAGTKKISATVKPLSTKLEKKVTLAQAAEPSRLQKIIEFFKEVKLELSKVIWPPRNQITRTTLVVILFVLIVSMFLGLFDFGLSTLVQVILT